MTRKSKTNRSSGLNDANFSKFNEYDNVNYEGDTTLLVLYSIFII